MGKGWRLIVACVVFTLSVETSNAHPHLWVTMKCQIIFNADGLMAAVRHAWSFDEMASAFITLGAGEGQKGVMTREKSTSLAAEQVASLKSSDYFTNASVNGYVTDSTKAAIIGAFEQHDARGRRSVRGDRCQSHRGRLGQLGLDRFVQPAPKLSQWIRIDVGFGERGALVLPAQIGDVHGGGHAGTTAPPLSTISPQAWKWRRARRYGT